MARVLASLFLLVLATPLAAQQAQAPAPGPGRIEGVVTDMWDKPIAGAEVWLVNRDLPRQRTGADGSFAFTRVPVGSQFARAAGRGGHRATARARISHEAPLQFVDIVVLPAADLDVRVVDDKGAPIAGAEVVPSRTASPGDVWSAKNERYVTGVDGKLRLTDLALGSTNINAVAPGFAFGSQRCYVGDGDEVVVTLQRGDALTLRFVLAGASKEQIGNATWNVYGMRDGYGAGCVLPPSLRGGSLDADGTATVRGLPLDMELTQLSIQLPDAAVEPRRLDLEAAPGPRTHELKFTVAKRDEPPVCGVAVDPAGKPVSGLALVCNSLEVNKAEMQTRTDDRGAFRFEYAVGLGQRFNLRSLDERWVFDQPKQDVFNQIRYRNVFESKLGPDPCEVRCIAATDVRGRIVDADGRGVPGIGIELTTQWEEQRTIDLAWATSDRDGMFALPRLNGTDERKMWIVANGRRGGAVSAPFVLGVGQQVRLPDLVLVPSGALTGTVRDAGGKPVFGATISLYRADAGSECDAISDRAGRFRVRGAPGAYRLLCWTGHQKDGDPQHRDVELRSGETIDVALVRTR